MKKIRAQLLGLSTLVMTTALCVAAHAQDSDAPDPSGAADTPNGGAIPPGMKLVPISDVAARSTPKRAENSIHAEGLGAGLVYSINYERLVLEDLGVRAGISYMSFGGTVSDGTSTVAEAKSTFMTFPVEVSYLGIGSAHHIFEVGGGLSLLYASGSASGVGYSSSGSGMGVLPNLLMGYRLHPVDGAGFQLRVGMMVFIGKGLGFDVTDPGKIGYLPWPYLSLGAAF